MKLGWYLKRLRIMNTHEIVHRIYEQCQLQLIKLSYKFNRDRYAPSQYSHTDFGFYRGDKTLPVLEWQQLPELVGVADGEPLRHLLDGQWPALAAKWRWQAGADSWLTAPDTGELWPNKFFADINYREGNACGDIRFLWEPARLQQLTLLARIAATTDNASIAQQALDLLQAQLLSFANENPLYQGPHYISAMECGLRIVAITHALDMVRDHLQANQQLWQSCIALVHGHADLLSKRLSLYSSAGNHTVAECLGLLYAGLLFPELSDAKRWLAVAIPLLESELDRQVLSDGGGIEQSTWYHFLTTEMGVLAAKLLRHSQQPSAVLEAANKRAVNFLNTLANRANDLPLIGDSDSGYALSRYVNLAFEEVGKDAEHRRHDSRLNLFKATGLSILNGHDDQRCTIKHGSFGMAPAFGHGHADALSVTLNYGANALLVDPGTYSYTGKPEWRRYFRSTAAHNTVSLEQQDQARQVSAFMWSETKSAELLSSDATGSCSFVFARMAWELDYPYEHYRGCIFEVDGTESGRWIFWDYLKGDAMASACLNWHLAEVPEREKSGKCNRFYFQQPQILTLTIEGADEISEISGSSEPIAGWQSTVYGAKNPITSLLCRYNGPLPHEFTTIISHGDAVSANTELSAQVLELIDKLKKQIV